MLKKSIVIIMLISFVSMTYFSCTGESDPVTPDDSTRNNTGNTGKVIKREDVGMLHNEVLTEFNKRVPLLSGEKVNIETFVKQFVESTNETLKREKYINRITEKDVARVLKKFIELKSEGTINFFKLPEDIPENSINNLAEKGYFSRESANEYLRVFKEIKAKGKESIIFTQKPNLLLNSIEAPKADNYDLFIDVSKHSYTFWSDLHSSNDSDSTFSPAKWEAIQTIYWDACGALAGLIVTGGAFFGAGGIVGALMGSIAFLIWGDDLEDWADDLLD